MICDKNLSERALPKVWDEKQTDWTLRRRELRELLQREVYGYLPEAPQAIRFVPLPGEATDGNFCAGKASVRRILLEAELNGKRISFPFCAVIPRNQSNLPFFVHINFRDQVPDKYMPTQEIVDNGFAVFSFCYLDVTTDDGDFDNGLAGAIFRGRPREQHDCGKIAMWAWAASRVMDYCQTLDCLDLRRGAVVGHSRLGKTALVAGMMDPRFSCAISNDSGCAGAALARGNQGERVSDITRNFPFWFAPNYLQYSDNETTMPFDQHFLLAACAPRAVYVASAAEDAWADPNSEYLSCCAAGAVYERLGLTGFVHPDRLPQCADTFHDGSIGYHLRAGRHYLSREDWNQFFRFLSKIHETAETNLQEDEQWNSAKNCALDMI